MATNYLAAVVLGIVEGLTEFVPVSSTGHLILTGKLLNFTGDQAATFMILIQLGAILSVVVLYRDRFVSLLAPRDGLGNYWSSQVTGRGRLNLAHFAVACLPALMVGFLLHDFIKAYLFTPLTVLIGLLLGSLVMILAEWRSRREITSLDRMSYGASLVVGLAQCLSLWPGFSRSGATISGGLAARMDHRTAAEFSFLIAVPIMMAATGYDLIKSWSFITPDFWGVLLVGFVTSFVVSALSVIWFLKLVRRVGLVPFALYRIVLAVTYYFLAM